MGELFNSSTQSFNEDNYKILLKYITGNANATLATATALAETNNNQFTSYGYTGTDASVFRANTLSAGTEGSTSYTAKTNGKDICVRLGGLDWQVMYLSKDDDNNTILTLWLDNNTSNSGVTCSTVNNLITNSQLYNYIVILSQVSWQYDQEPLFDYDDDTIEYVENNYGVSDGYVCEPSVSEINYLWNASSSQRANSESYSVRTLMLEAGEEYGMYVSSAGGGYAIGYGCARPVIHINLNLINSGLNIVSVGELYNSSTQTFDKDNYNILLKYLTGNANATLETVTALAETNNNQYSSSGYIGTDASVMRAKTLSAGTEGNTSYTAKTNGEDICVRLGGYEWDVVYLSKDINGNTVLTLWLNDNISSPQNTTPNFVSSDPLSGYIVVPFNSDYSSNSDKANLSWQLNQDSIVSQYDDGDDYPTLIFNDGIVGDYSGLFSSQWKYEVTHTFIDMSEWYNGYVWAPSISEVNHLWNLSTYQYRYSRDFLLRSICYDDNDYEQYIDNIALCKNGSTFSSLISSSTDTDSYRERPAIHLNLTQINAIVINRIDISTGDGSISVSPNSSVYNGSVKTPTITVTYNGTTLVNGTDYTLSYTLNGSTVSEIKEAGIYTITATGNVNYKGSLSTTYVVEGGTIASTTISAPNDCVVFKRSDGLKIYLNDSSYRLILGTDYTADFSINYTALTGTALVTGIGNYGGVVRKTFILILLDPNYEVYIAVYAT